MSKKLSIDDFLTRSRQIHGNKYDYSKVEYTNNHTKICIICPEHGEFWQTPKRHLSSNGCPKCAIQKMAQLKTHNNEQFITMSKKKYGDIFDYSLVNYINCDTEVTLICKKHGEFNIKPIRHLQNEYGCPLCYEEKRNAKKRDSLSSFIEKANIIHGNKYDYSKTIYKNNRTEITVICPEHGEFKILPSAHIHNNRGCPKCQENELKCRKTNKILEKEKKAIEKKKIKEISISLKESKFIEKAKKIHNNKYDYSKVKYINNRTKVCIVCPEHGEFWQEPHNHLRGCQCHICSRSLVSLKNRDTKEDFIEKAKKIHNNKYDYSKVNYINNHTKVCIICPEHGEFWQTPAMHSSEGQGCPNCATLSSKGENEIVNFIKEIINDTIIQRDKTILNSRKEIDIYIPNKNIAIEYNGLRWHSELFNEDKFYHLSKTIECEKKGIRLIHIFEDEWVHKQTIVKEKLKHLLGVSKCTKIYGRQCVIKHITSSDAKTFLEKYHIQGASRATIHYGAYHQDTLIAVMSFLKDKIDKHWELVRFASDYNYVCCGIGGKIFKAFLTEQNPIYVKSFADRRWTVKDTDNIYTKMGFKLEKVLPPQYSYVTTLNSFRKRIHKFNCRKQILHKKYGLPLSMTEREMAQQLQLYRIYDCGLYKYVWEEQ